MPYGQIGTGNPQKNASNMLSGLFKGSESQYGQQDIVSPEVKQQLQQLLSRLPMQQGMDTLTNQLGGNSGMQGDLMRQFQEEIMPQMAEQYAGAGAMGSSGFAQQMTQGAGRLTSQLGALGAQTQQQGMQNLQGMFGQATKQTQMPTFKQGDPSMISQIMPLLAELLSTPGVLK